VILLGVAEDTLLQRSEFYWRLFRKEWIDILSFSDGTNQYKSVQIGTNSVLCILIVVIFYFSCG